MQPTIRDICLDDEFVGDYGRAPERVQKAVDKLIRMILDSGGFPNSTHLHKMEKLELWSVYVTVSRQSWRLLVNLNEDGSITFHRLMDHVRYSNYLRSLTA